MKSLDDRICLIECDDGSFVLEIRYSRCREIDFLRAAFCPDRFKEASEKRIRLYNVRHDTLQCIGLFLEDKLDAVQLTYYALFLVQAADFLGFERLRRASSVVIANNLSNVKGFGLLAPEIIQAIVLLVPARHLLQAERMAQNSLLAPKNQKELFQRAWSRCKISKEKCIEVYIQQLIAKVPKRKALEEAIGLYGNHLYNLRICNKRLSNDQLVNLVERFHAIESLDLSGAEPGIQEIALIMKAVTNRPSSLCTNDFALLLANINLTDAGLHCLVSFLSHEHIPFKARKGGGGKRSRNEQKENTQSKGMRLRSLNVSNCTKLGDIGLQIIVDTLSNGGVRVSKLDLSRNNKIFGVGGTVIPVQLYSLHVTHLNLSRTGCDVARVLEALFCPKGSNNSDFRSTIQELDLSDNCALVPSDTLERVFSQTGFRGLERVWFGGNSFEEPTFEVFASHMKNGDIFQSLRHLSFSNVSLTPTGAREVISGVERLPVLEALDVSRNSLPCKETAMFALLISSHSKLSQLDVSGNAINSIVAGAFGAALTQNPSNICSLNLGVPDWQKHMRVEGCAAMCRGILAIHDLPISLQFLDLSGHLIKCDGCMLLANVFRRHNMAHFRGLTLRDNGIGDRGAVEIFRAMSGLAVRCGEAIELNITSNPISKQVIDTILLTDSKVQLKF